MEFVTLVENSSDDNRLQPEFGLSLLVKTRTDQILFDMGAGGCLLDNAEQLDEDLTRVSCGVVSHAHYDHGGGLGAFIEKNDHAPIYIGQGAAGNYRANGAAIFPALIEPLVYSLTQSRKRFSRYVGLDKAHLYNTPKRFVEVAATQEIASDVFLIAHTTNHHPTPEGNKYLLKEDDGMLVRDDFGHELIMVVRDPDGMVLITGCGHRGILNMVDTVQKTFAGESLKAVVGGFHLARQPGKPAAAGGPEAVAEIAHYLKERGVKKVISGHCTGDEACRVLADVLGEQFELLSTGSRHTV